ncbi:hypothetical protein DFH07DRAFT_830676 [Mycena maculata]|uniref:Uncharacterized protein n=1 Tax=Mycena maculata TaxID=230809 RepID=A0AAD7IRS5_9AGAR|nr:hypothetical protein DFH07DRAFT_830676 [Mycena maculata]
MANKRKAQTTLDHSNGRDLHLQDLVLEGISNRNPQFHVQLLFMLKIVKNTWSVLRSPLDSVRNGFRFRGCNAFRYVLMLAFDDITDGLEQSFPSGFHASKTFEQCLMSEHVLFELRKPYHRIAGEGIGYVSGGFFMFMGGLWQEAKGLTKIMPFITTVFLPLLRIAMGGYFSCGQPPKQARRFAGGTPTSSDMCVLGRIFKIQLAKKPEWSQMNYEALKYFDKARTLVLKPAPCVSPSNNSLSSYQDSEDEDHEQDTPMPIFFPWLGPPRTASGLDSEAKDELEDDETTSIPRAPFRRGLSSVGGGSDSDDEDSAGEGVIQAPSLSAEFGRVVDFTSTANPSGLLEPFSFPSTGYDDDDEKRTTHSAVLGWCHEWGQSPGATYSNHFYCRATSTRRPIPDIGRAFRPSRPFPEPR